MPLKFQGPDLVLDLYIQPKASRDQWLGLHGAELKLAITAPPTDGSANTARRSHPTVAARITTHRARTVLGGTPAPSSVAVLGQIPLHGKTDN